MSFNFSPPAIDNGPDEKQLKQIRSWLFQLTEQLRYTLNNLDMDNFNKETAATISGSASSAKDSISQELQSTQKSILKSLIVKTAELVSSEMQVLEQELTGKYVAQSDYGQFVEETETKITATSTGITQNYNHFEEITTGLEESAAGFNTYKTRTSAYIHSGFLGYDDVTGLPVYGIAVGENLQSVEIDGESVLVGGTKCATFTSDKLTFYQGQVPVAWLSNNKLYITDAEITGNLTIGKFIIETDNGFTIKWIGGDV